MRFVLQQWILYLNFARSNNSRFNAMSRDNWLTCARPSTMNRNCIINILLRIANSSVERFTTARSWYLIIAYSIFTKPIIDGRPQELWIFSRGVVRKYGFKMRRCGHNLRASSSGTAGCTMTSLPGTQLMGVVTRNLSPVWSESTMRSTSAEFRPVDAGYERMARMVFFGSMMKTDRIVKAMPFSSTLVVSW